eukprot:Nk52_evm59s2367 gene=Nk52_evmTU59s2367
MKYTIQTCVTMLLASLFVVVDPISHNLTKGIWVVVTASILNVAFHATGKVIFMGLMRALGAIAGALSALLVAVIVFYPHEDCFTCSYKPYLTVALFVIGTGINCWLSYTFWHHLTFLYVFTQVTFTIVVYGFYQDNAIVWDTTSVGFARAYECLIGAVLSVLVALVVFPTTSTALYRDNVCYALNQMSHALLLWHKADTLDRMCGCKGASGCNYNGDDHGVMGNYVCDTQERKCHRHDMQQDLNFSHVKIYGNGSTDYCTCLNALRDEAIRTIGRCTTHLLAAGTFLSDSFKYEWARVECCRIRSFHSRHHYQNILQETMVISHRVSSMLLADGRELIKGRRKLFFSHAGAADSNGDKDRGAMETLTSFGSIAQGNLGSDDDAEARRHTIEDIVVHIAVYLSLLSRVMRRDKKRCRRAAFLKHGQVIIDKCSENGKLLAERLKSVGNAGQPHGASIDMSDENYNERWYADTVNIIHFNMLIGNMKKILLFVQDCGNL